MAKLCARNPKGQDHVAAMLPRMMHAFLAVNTNTLKFACSFKNMAVRNLCFLSSINYH